MADVQAGIARAVITPPVGIAMIGFAGRGPATGIHDELTATALALECGNSRAVIVAGDLLWFPDRFARETREEIARQTGVGAGSVLLCASHTHYGPAMGGDDPGSDPPDVAAYLGNLKYLVAGAAREALSALQPVRLGFGRGESRIGINRRERRPDGQIILGQNPDGPCEREVRVVRLNAPDGAPLACVVNFACHPVSAAHNSTLFSPDWVGESRKLVESATGARCVFLQGAAGNINPIEMRPSYEPARRLGVMLGGEVAKVFESTSTEPVSGLAAGCRQVELPAMRFDSVDEADRTVEERRKMVEMLKAKGSTGGDLFWGERLLSSAERMRESLRSGQPLPGIPAELCALRFGDVALATSPGEIFTQTGMAITQQSPISNTLFAGYTNGSIGYVPVPSAYPEGGYEVTHACRVAAEAAGIIESTALTLLAEVRS